MKTMKKLITFAVLLTILLPAIHGDAYGIYVADSTDMSSFIFAFSVDTSILQINDPYQHYYDNALDIDNSPNFPRSQYIPGFTLNGLDYEYETDVETQGRAKVHAFVTEDELEPDVATALRSTALNYPGVVIIDEATGKYNCHSYAWYMESTVNPYWIPEAEAYGNDVHSVWRAENETPQPGDICVYMVDGVIKHSAVVDRIEEGTIICRSKWGQSVLCEHPSNAVPTGYWQPGVGPDCRFIKITPHEWNYEPAGTNQHTRTCTICSHEETLSCEYEYTYFYDDMHNASCKYCSNGYAGAFCSFTSTYNGDGTHTRSCNSCSNAYTDSCNLEYTNLTNTRHSVSCTVCDYEINSQLCTLTYTSNGNKTHTVRCTLCGNSRVNNCSLVTNSADANQHFTGCNKCDYGYYSDCVAVYVYCGSDTLGDVHKRVCQTCDNPMSSGTESCELVYQYNGQVNGSNTHVHACTDCGHVDSGPTACTYIGTKPCLQCGSLKDQVSINESEEDAAQG